MYLREGHVNIRPRVYVFIIKKRQGINSPEADFVSVFHYNMFVVLIVRSFQMLDP